MILEFDERESNIIRNLKEGSKYQISYFEIYPEGDKFCISVNTASKEKSYFDDFFSNTRIIRTKFSFSKAEIMKTTGEIRLRIL